MARSDPTLPKTHRPRGPSPRLRRPQPPRRRQVPRPLLRLLVPQTHSVLVPIHHIINNNNNNKHPLSLSSLLRSHSPATGELGVGDGVFLKWRAEFGSTLHSCAVLGASSLSRVKDFVSNSDSDNEDEENDSGSCIPESFYTNGGGLKLRVVWTISSLIAASARHYLLEQIISDHKTLDSLVLTDADRQGVLSMAKNQLKELREKPLSASMVPALNMTRLELADGRVMKGATLVAIRPREEEGGGGGERKEAGPEDEGEWVSGPFEEPFGAAARMLVKRRTYCLEMNSFLSPLPLRKL